MMCKILIITARLLLPQSTISSNLIVGLKQCDKWTVSIHINWLWTSPFQILGVLGSIFHLYSAFDDP